MTCKEARAILREHGFIPTERFNENMEEFRHPVSGILYTLIDLDIQHTGREFRIERAIERSMAKLAEIALEHCS